KFAAHKFTLPPDYPEDSMARWTSAPGELMGPVREASYDIKEDSKRKVWFTLNGAGILMSLDPATGETKRYEPPAITDSPFFMNRLCTLKGLALFAYICAKCSSLSAKSSH